MALFLAGLCVVVAGVAGVWFERSRAQQASRRLELELAGLRAQLMAREARLRELAGTEERVVQLAQALTRAETQLAAEQRVAHERAAAQEAWAAQAKVELHAGVDSLGRALITSGQSGLEQVLGPMRERLKEFEERVRQHYDAENRDRGALLERLRGLQEAQTRLHADAQALTRALTRDSKSQGDWGELVLESLLSSAGLTEGREYELQVDHRDEHGGHRRPDALIYLPPDRALVVDSKCSLTAFVESTRTPDDDAREMALEAHVHSLRTHVKALAAKDYQRLLGARTLDLVLLFVPSEAAFHAAVTRDPQLAEDALRQRVVLTSPTTLLATLQVVHHVWRSERQHENAQRIAREAARMIEKLALGLEAFVEVGDRLDKAQQAFEDARKRLVTGRGNALQIARRVAELGARPPERLSQVAERLDAELDDEALVDALEAVTSGPAEQLELVPGRGE